jgi:hypothetical protein
MRRLVVLLAALSAATGALALFAPSGGADTDPNVSPVTFDVCGTKSWVVPARVTSATFDIFGAAGGVGTPDLGTTGSSDGGLGGHSTATIAVTPGETLTIVVGCAGQGAVGVPINTGTDGGSGSGSGGDTPAATNQGGGGGGGSAVARGSTRLLVAGGGGGGGAGQTATEAEGGDGGGANQDGENGADAFGACGGDGGTTTAVGAGGSSINGTGDPGSGGDGGDASTNDAAGNSHTTSGAGGGGYFGGGGGGAIANSPCGGGGGGSGFADPAATDVAFENGVQDGDGLVTITFVQGPELIVSFTG